jgi:hypothetical protein
VPTCIDAPIDAFGVARFVIDATDQEIGIAWMSPGSTGDLGLHFARFAPDLTLIQQVGPFGPDCPTNVTLAASGGGWSLAVDTASGMHLIALDAAGALTSDVIFLDRIDVAPKLVPRAGSQPLLLSTPIQPSGSRSLVKAALVNAAGNGLGAESSLTGFPGELPYRDDETGIAVPDGWLVAVTAMSGGRLSAYVTHLDPSGAPSGGGAVAPFGPDIHWPHLAITAGEVRMSVSSFGTLLDPRYVSLTTSGAIAGPVVLIPGLANFSGPAEIAILGTDTLAVRHAFINGLSAKVELARVNVSGMVVHATRTLAASPEDMYSSRIVRRGSEAIVAWINGAPIETASRLGPTGLGLARVAP